MLKTYQLYSMPNFKTQLLLIFLLLTTHTVSANGDKKLVCDGISRIFAESGSTDPTRVSKTYDLAVLASSSLCNLTESNIECTEGNIASLNNRQVDSNYFLLKIDRYSGSVTEVVGSVTNGKMMLTDFSGSCRAARKKF